MSNELFCKSGECIAVEKRCDRVKDCYDGSDEANCLLAGGWTF